MEHSAQKPKQVGQYLFWMATFSLCFLLVKIKVAFTISGELSLFLVELVGLGAGVFVLFYLRRFFNTRSNEEKGIVLVAGISQGCLIIVYVLRCVLYGVELKSIAVFEANLFLFGLFFLLVFRILSVRIAIESLSLFCVILGALSIFIVFCAPNYYLDNFIFCSSRIKIQFTGNPFRTYVSLFCLPVSALNYFLSGKKSAAMIYLLHLSTLIFCVMISGARANYVCLVFVLLFIILLFLLMKRNHKRSISLWTVVVTVLTIILVYVVSPYNISLYSQLTRLDVSKQVIEKFNINYSMPEIEEPVEVEDETSDTYAEVSSAYVEYMDNAQTSAEESLNARRTIWPMAVNDFLNAPWFGKGLKQYELTANDGSSVFLLPHNFLLEYLLSFGIVGFVLWTSLFAITFFYMIKEVKFKFWKNPVFLFACCSGLTACACAFVQPYFMYSGVMAFVYVLLGIYYVESKCMFSEDIS